MFEEALAGSPDNAPARDDEPTRDSGRNRRNHTTEVSAASAEPPAEAGPYRIVAELGRGGMGVVYKAEDPRLGRFVALKFVAAHHSLNAAEATRRLLAEARAASVLDHPNICTIHDIGQTGDGRVFFAMAYYQGLTLSQRLRQGPIPAAEAVSILMQAARGLAHAHELGVVHRDVKPSNLLVTDDDEIKILDFGLARVGLSDLTRPGTRLGTLAYMSPEQARGRAVDHRTDVWSLGVVLHELLTGALPLPDETDALLLHALLQDDAALRLADAPELPPLWRLIAGRALERAPERRYRSMADMLRDLSELEAEIRHRSPWPATARDQVGAEALAGDGEAAVSSRSAPSLPGMRTSSFSGRHRSVGRELELEELRTAWVACASGRGALLCVTGEPGIGKTTVVEDFLDQIEHGDPAWVARGRCSERLAGTEAYLPILEALESLLRGEGRDLALALIKDVAPTWYVRVAPATAAADASFVDLAGDARLASQERMKRELLTFLQELSRRRPLALFCDDLHWADVSTVDLLAYVAARCDSMRLLVLGTYRPSDLLLAKHPFLNVQRELQSRGLCREIPVRLLDQEAIASYLALMFPGHSLPDHLPGLLQARTEGNPLFLVELLADLRDHGVIERHDGGWRLERALPSLGDDLPESVRGMIERKLDRVDEEDRRLLAAAAVQGHEFDSATLARALRRDVGELEERFEVLARAHRVVRVLAETELPDGDLTQRYHFVHVLYQNALYAALRPRQRAETALAVAEALLASHRERSVEISARLGYLFETARRPEPASDHFLVATRKAIAIYANREALELCRRALANADRLEGEARHPRVLAAASQLGQLHLTLSQLQQAIEAFALADQAAAAIGDVDARVDAICAGALARFNLTRTAESMEEARRALELARGAGSSGGAAAAELVLGLESLCLGETDEAERSFERSVPVLREQGPPLHALEAIGFAGLLYAWQLEYDTAERAVGWTLERARGVGSSYHTIMNLFVRGMALFNQGRLAAGLADLEEGMRLAEQNGETYWLSRFPNTLGWAWSEVGDIERARCLNLEGVARAHENGYGKPEANSHLNLAQHHLDHGELNDARTHLDHAAEIFEKDFWFRWRYNIRLKAELSRYWMMQGDTARAGAFAAESLELAAPRKARKHMAWAHKLLGDVAVAEERFAHGRREYDAALAVLAHHHCPIVEWRILLAAADMASAYRDVGLAEHYRDRCQAVLHGLARSLGDERLSRRFLRSERVAAALL